jgi:hypothetical protein
MRPNPSDPERTVGVAIVATRPRSNNSASFGPSGPRFEPRAYADIVHRCSQTRLRKVRSSGVTSSMHWLADVARATFGSAHR